MQQVQHHAESRAEKPTYPVLSSVIEQAIRLAAVPGLLSMLFIEAYVEHTDRNGPANTNQIVHINSLPAGDEGADGADPGNYDPFQADQIDWTDNDDEE